MTVVSQRILYVYLDKNLISNHRNIYIYIYIYMYVFIYIYIYISKRTATEYFRREVDTQPILENDTVRRCRMRR